MTATSSGNILAIFAHPDDESFFCAGTLAKYAEAGHDVYLICATSGEEGEILHPAVSVPADSKREVLGKLRQAELQDACKALGIHPPIFLGYNDSGFPLTAALANPQAFAHKDVFNIASQLVALFDKIKPSVVITFDPYGMYGHIDHIIIHRAATAAFWLTDHSKSPAPKRLYYPVRNHPDDLEEPIAPFLNMSRASLAATIDVRAQATKIRAALSAHRSQVGPEMNLDQLAQNWPNIFKEEWFVLGGLRGGFPNTPVTDLFAA
jgi:N-acetyl-1-D-myo-inositol-2-amino-2-deoxy-alpha-D-glucopyranoside deacetylase